MKKHLLILLLLPVTLALSAGQSGEADEFAPEKSSSGIVARKEVLQADITSPKVDCTIKMKWVTEEGIVVEGTITFEDVSRWDCTRMKVANFFSKIF